MHELSIAQSIVEAIETRARACEATHVKCVRLKIGAANGIVDESLAFCFEMLTNEVPILAGAQLSIDTMSHRAQCHHCAKAFAIANYVAQCPTCLEWSNDIISGTELQIMDMEIETT